MLRRPLEAEFIATAPEAAVDAAAGGREIPPSAQERSETGAPAGGKVVDFPRPKKTRARAGRPTKYRREYCEQVIACGREGHSRTQMACAFGVARKTLSYWAKVHPDFDWAYQFALTCSQAHWEHMGMEGCSLGSKFNAAAYIFQMKARFPEDYGNKRGRNRDEGSSMAEFWEGVDLTKWPEPTYED